MFTEKVSFLPKYEFSAGNAWKCSKSNFPGDFPGAGAFCWDGGKKILVDNVSIEGLFCTKLNSIALNVLLGAN